MKRWLAPEVIQTSNLDCGPATLKCLLAGFGIPVSYGQLREICQTGLDGTSIDTMELVANQMGLQAEQITVPLDHVFIPEAKALPAIAIVQLPSGLTHFVVIWNRVGSRLQVMDPATGRRWVHQRALSRDLYRHTMAVPADGWREWAGSEDFLAVLRVRLERAGITHRQSDAAISKACADPSWRGLACVDAAARLVQSLADSGALPKRSSRGKVFQTLCDKPVVIPAQYWTLTPTSPAEDGSEQVLVSGAVLVRALGRVSTGVNETASKHEDIRRERGVWQVGLRLLSEAGRTGIAVASLGILGTASLTIFEAILFRSLFDVFSRLRLPWQQFGALSALGIFAAAALALEWATISSVIRLGRHFETRLRLAFLRKLPKLSDRYLQSRLISDLADRAHAAYRLKQFPNAVSQFVTPLVRLLLTIAGLAWLMPHAWPLLSLIIAATLIPPVIALPVLRERDLKTRTQAGSLMRFYLDAMLGLMPIRAHRAARNLKSEQEQLLGEWASSAIALQKTALTVEGVQTLLVLALVTALLLTQSFESTAAGRLLLIVYWALNVPLLGRDVAAQIRRYPYYRNLLARLVEPLEAPEEAAPIATALTRAPEIEFQNVSASIAGAMILNNLELRIQSGEHIAIVGPSGAGKSSLVSLLLGWLPISSGEVLVNGEPLRVEQIRASCAWIDPAIQIWNDSLFANIVYGSDTQSTDVSRALDNALLRSVLESLPQGLQTKLGESGGLVSGGEGQRVRFARATLRTNASLAILDEPFRGLDRHKRRELLARARQIWRNATLLCVTHDIAQTRSFDRVVIVENGLIAECGRPAELLANGSSRYSQLLASERNAYSGLWAARFWRRIWVENGRAVETVGEPADTAEAEVA